LCIDVQDAHSKHAQPNHLNVKSMKRYSRIPAVFIAAALSFVTTSASLLAQDPATAPPGAPAAAPPAPAETAAAPALAAATIEQRVTDLEQYFQNVAVGASGDVKWNSKIANVPGPGHNGWMMTSAALVLFMTLPGLALFYGGLVRKKMC
jgi:hypothetical protein